MTIQKRSLVLGSLLVIAVIFYGAAKYYSPSLVFYVVEQSLLQKSPSGLNPNSLRARFHASISAVPDKNSKMERLLQISEYLEKVQRLSFAELNQLLAIEKPEKPRVLRNSLGFPENAEKKAGEHPAL
jgi:hypothetical protein